MQAAPAVAVKSGGGWQWRLVNSALPALAAAALAMLALQHAEQSVWPAAMAAALVFGFAWWQAKPKPLALNWDGQRWTADDVPGDMAVMVDLGLAMLLRMRLQGGAVRWLAITATDAGSAWHGLRAAAYARPPGTARRLRNTSDTQKAAD